MEKLHSLTRDIKSTNHNKRLSFSSRIRLKSTMSSTFTTNNTYSKSDYLQPAFSSTSPSTTSSSASSSTSVSHVACCASLSLGSFQYDASQSPLALLAQTCSSIGKDCPSPPAVSTPPIITSLVSKTSSSNQEKAFLSTKRSLSSHVNRKSTLPLKPSPVGKSSSSSSSSSPLIESNLSSSHFPSLFDPTATALLLRSSLAYLAAQQQHSYSSACPIPGCLQCETVRHILAASTVNNQSYACHGRYNSSSEELLLEQARALTSASHRFHPYLKPTTTTPPPTRSSAMINNNDQLPFFYPHLSLSPLTGSTRRMNNNPNNTN